MVYNPNLPTYNEVVTDAPIIITVPVAARPLYQGVGYKWVVSYVIKVRSMGTATYIGIGDQFSQLYRLTVANQTLGFAANPGEIIDMAKIWIVADTADPVVEIIAAYLPVSLYGNVKLAQGQSQGM
jgi:hypothetical protein